MSDLGKEPLGQRARKWALNYLHNSIGYPIVAAAVGFIVTYLVGKGWPIVFLVGIGCAFVASLSFGAYVYITLRPLKKWRDLTAVTDLTEFEHKNADSKYMPGEILKREDIHDLAVMGNGCSKWTMYVPEKQAIAQLGSIRRKANKAVRFLASCPKALSERDGTADERKWMKQKAIHNAKSLLQLRDFKRRTEHSGGRFEIRTYKHLATLRLIVINEFECIVGHYKEDGTGQSFDTPLMVFKCTNSDQWGFGHAFRRLFDHEWHRAVEPTEEEWKAMEQLASQLSSSDLDYPK